MAAILCKDCSRGVEYGREHVEVCSPCSDTRAQDLSVMLRFALDCDALVVVDEGLRKSIADALERVEEVGR